MGLRAGWRLKGWFDLNSEKAARIGACFKKIAEKYSEPESADYGVHFMILRKPPAKN